MIKNEKKLRKGRMLSEQAWWALIIINKNIYFSNRLTASQYVWNFISWEV